MDGGRDLALISAHSSVACVAGDGQRSVNADDPCQGVLTDLS